MIHFIVYIFDHVDHEDLPLNIVVCGTVSHRLRKQNSHILLVVLL